MEARGDNTDLESVCVQVGGGGEGERAEDGGAGAQGGGAHGS